MTTKTRKDQTETSRILDAVHETARDLHTAGFISKRRMKDYEALRLVPVLEYTAEMALVEVVRRRLIEHRRNQLADEIQEAQRDLPTGRCQPATPDEILRDILS